MIASPPFWRDRRVLVTGGGGFIGSRLTRQLGQLGAEIHAVGRTAPSHLEVTARTWARDLSKQGEVEDLIGTVRPHVVFHMAGAVTGSRDIDLVRATFEGNLASTVHLLVEATKAGCERIVVAGSMEEPRLGDLDPLPPSPYAAAKWASTVYARMFRALYGSPVVVLRLFMVYGPGQRDGTKLVPYVGRCFLDGVPPRLSSGRRPVDWVYVDDVVDACIRAAEAPEVADRALDVGSGTQTTIRDVVERIARLTGTDVEPIFGALPDRPLEVAPVANVDETDAILGWRAKTGLDEGLRRTVEWLRERPALR